MNKREFSKLVRQGRKASELSAPAYARKLGCSYVTLWRWEKGVVMPKPDALDYWLEKIK